MKLFLSLTFIFVSGSLLGWIIELFYRRFAHKTWINPGFLKGPYVPLYGFGLAILYSIAAIPFENFVNEKWIIILIRIILVAILMTLIELIAGLIFIKGMKIQLWDYSDRKGNFMGIICPLFSFFWAIIGASYVLLLHPLIVDAVIWLTDNLIYSFFVGIVFGFMIYDFLTSMNLAFKIKKFAQDKQVIIKYEALKEHLKAKAKEMKNKVHFLKPLGSFQKVIIESLSPAIEFFSKLDSKNKGEEKDEN